jgi:dTDP-glucose pyrophosphorylase
MNLIIPIASGSNFFKIEEFGYPKPLIEIMGRPMIQHVIENIVKGIEFKKIIFIVRQDDCEKYHLDQTLNLLSPIPPIIVKVRGETQGALCSVLLAIDHIYGDEPLIIANADQIFDGGVADEISRFTSGSLDAACLAFNSVHPRWSYVRLNQDGNVVEAAEKRPISRNAIAGLYCYKSGIEFVKNSMSSIKNGSSVEGKYFISPVFNEYVLAGKSVGCFLIDNQRYHSFYTPQKIYEYEQAHSRV